MASVWKEAGKKGLQCARSNFYRLIRNPVYCGLIIVAKYKDEPETWVKAQHQGIISETTYWAVQKAIEQAKPRKQKAQIRLRPELLLRGFLDCPQCSRVLSGSGSRGKYRVYHYYHCSPPCGHRVRADQVNAAFITALANWQPDPCFQPLYQLILNGVHQSQTSDQRDFRQQVFRQLDAQHTRLSKARELLLKDTLDVDEYQEIKTTHQTRIIELQNQLDQNIDPTDRFGPPIKTSNRLTNLAEYYQRANIKNKRRIVALLFPTNMIFRDGHIDFGQLSTSTQLVYSEKSPC